MNGGPLTDSDVETFISKIKQADNDKKVDQIQFFGLKLEDATSLPQDSFDALTLTVAPLLQSSSQLLSTSVLNSFLPFYSSLIPLHPPHHLQVALRQFLPVLLDKINDPKERVNAAASSNVAILGRKCYEAEAGTATSMVSSSSGKGKEKETLIGYWERMVKECLSGKGWRGKVEAMKVLLAMRQEEKSKLALKPWLPSLVELLEDGDGNVRDQARETVVAMLSPSSTPAAARTELKKLLQARNVRKTIADGIMVRIFAGESAAPSDRNTPASGSGLEEGIGGLTLGPGTTSGVATPVNEEIEIVYIASGKDLEHEFATMFPHFQGKETEHNWNPRENGVIRIRGMLRGQAHQRYPDAFLAGLRGGFIEGLSKTLLSLRTTVAQQSCSLVQELAESLGSALDPFVENLLVVLGKMAGFTKKIIAERSRNSLSAIITHTTSHPRIFISHIYAGINDKNVQIRQHSISHMKTFIAVHGSRTKATIEGTAGLMDQIEAVIKKLLVDVNPQVRETARAAYWSFQKVWKTRAQAIMDSLEGTARKQLEKAKPESEHEIASVVAESPAKAPLIKPTGPKKPQASSAMSHLLAEKRRAKAAELAASRAAESSRAVSNPIPASPSIDKGTMGRAVSSQFMPTKKQSMIGRSNTSPYGSPEKQDSVLAGSPSKQVGPKSNGSAPQDLLTRSRSSSLQRTYSTSPTSSKGSPSLVKSPLSRTDQLPESTTPSKPSTKSPSLGTSATAKQGIRTPDMQRPSLPTSSSQASDLHVSATLSTPTNGHAVAPASPDEMRAQAEQAVSSAERLLDTEPAGPASTQLLTPVTPARTSSNGRANGAAGPSSVGSNYLLKTPLTNFMNGSSPSSNGRRLWEDSPKPEAMTPQMLTKLKERPHERGWWYKRQQLLDKASPLRGHNGRSNGNGDSASPYLSIRGDVEAIESGSIEMRNLQKLALFSEKYPIKGDDKEIRYSTRIWAEERLFERLFEGLIEFLDPHNPRDLLEQGLVTLWELVQHQWPLFEDKDTTLVDALFRLRTSSNNVILESTNSLISLLCDASEPLFFSSVIMGSLQRFLTQYPAEALNSSRTNGLTRKPEVVSGEAARASGYLFGLTGLGLCVLRLPKEVVSIEGAKLGPLVMEALESRVVTTRQAANTVIIAIQAVLMDTTATMALFPDLDDGQRNLAHYLMDKNGLLRQGTSAGDGDAGEATGEHRERVIGEMVGLLGRYT